MLEITDHGPIRQIKMVRPPVNALNPEFVQQLIHSLQQANSDPECDAVVISSKQGVFSAGLDVVELIQLEREDMTHFWGLFFELLETIACSRVPIATAITGHSPAGGAVMCLFSDYRVMSRGKYRIGLNETRVGLIIPPLLQNAMAHLVGPRVAEQMLVTGTLVEPEDALSVGLVDALESGYEATIERAIKWCEDLLALPRKAVLGNREIARAHYKRNFAENSASSITSFVNCWFSEEAQAVMHALVAQLKNKK
jgi:3,2-trans-enoyl-CoA isomerase